MKAVLPLHCNSLTS